MEFHGNATSHASKPTQQPTSKIIAESISVAAIPAVVMLFGSLFAIYSPKQPSKNLAHAIQHLAAGILLSAIALELIPTIAAAKGFNNLVGIIVGFSLGAMVMIALPLLLKEDEKDEEAHQKLEDECEEGRGTENQKQDELPSKPHFPEAENPSNPSGFKKVKVLCRKMKSRLFHLFDSGADHSSANIASEDISPFPAVFAAAVYIDSAMDGLLVGISLLSGASAGVFMAVAMASEMGFLGLSFALSLARRPKWQVDTADPPARTRQTLPAIAGGPLCMIVGAVVGGAGANALATNEPLLVGCTSFGVAALLYMVTEELLVSAHEDGFGHAWWVDIQVFVGFLTAVVLEKSMNAEAE